jgi:hypothetical protein
MAPGATTNDEKFLARMAGVATIILASSGTVCLLAWFYLLYAYGWMDRRRIADWQGTLLYYVFPAALAALLFASLRLRASHRINVALVLCSMATVLYPLEFGLSVWLSLPSVRAAEDRRVRAAAARARGLDFDTRSRLAVARDLVSRGADAVPFISPWMLLLEGESDETVTLPISIAGTEVLPLAAIANRLVVMCNDTGQFLTFRSDGYGFNNPPGVWERARADIVALGDSFVHGHCLDDHFVNVIRKRYPATLNLGAGGNGPLVMLATLKEYARAARPKVVLWFYFEGNDLKNLSVERKSPLLRRYLTDGFSQNLIERQTEVDAALAAYLEAVKDRSDLSVRLDEVWTALRELRDPGYLQKRATNVLKLTSIRRRLGLLYGVPNPSVDGAAGPLRERERALIHLLYEVLAEARRSVDQWEGRLYFVYLPSWSSFAAKGNVAEPVRTAVLAAARQAGLSIIDIHPVFARHPDPVGLFPFRLDGHYTEEANRLVAAAVLRSIAAAE